MSEFSCDLSPRLLAQAKQSIVHYRGTTEDGTPVVILITAGKKTQELEEFLEWHVKGDRPRRRKKRQESLAPNAIEGSSESPSPKDSSP